LGGKKKKGLNDFSRLPKGELKVPSNARGDTDAWEKDSRRKAGAYIGE